MKSFKKHTLIVFPFPPSINFHPRRDVVLKFICGSMNLSIETYVISTRFITQEQQQQQTHNNRHSSIFEWKLFSKPRRNQNILTVHYYLKEKTKDYFERHLIMQNRRINFYYYYYFNYCYTTFYHFFCATRIMTSSHLAPRQHFLGKQGDVYKWKVKLIEMSSSHF